MNKHEREILSTLQRELGTKKIDIQVKYPTDGAAATSHAELVGEYVKSWFNDPA